MRTSEVVVEDVIVATEAGIEMRAFEVSVAHKIVTVNDNSRILQFEISQIFAWPLLNVGWQTTDTHLAANVRYLIVRQPTCIYVYTWQLSVTILFITDTRFSFLKFIIYLNISMEDFLCKEKWCFKFSNYTTVNELWGNKSKE